MLFNSIEFALFIPIIFFLYWFVLHKSIQLQNVLLLVSSYFFYGLWDWRFLGLIIFSSLVDYFIGLSIEKSENNKSRRGYLFLSLTMNIGLLMFFKYCNFFIDSFVDTFSFFGKPINISSLNIILPVGISFYTFQTLSYSIDVYKKEIKATTDIISFLSFVSFFPQLVAGPIERATNLLPQFYKKRVFSYSLAADGLRQILWGLIKKIIIADNCAPIVNTIFTDYTDYSGSTLLLGAILFAFQIYGDFSGYSDIAIGTARLFGFKLSQNFAFPYFSRDIAEFWRRWHISLSTWFRDYLYIPLGGSRGGKWSQVKNTFIIFLISGFWHGANWTFIFWGTLNALLFIPLLVTNRNRNNISIVAQGKYIPTLKDLTKISSTFLLVVIAWIFFRADSINHAFEYIYSMLNQSLFSIPEIPGQRRFFPFLILFILIEWFQREKQHGLELNEMYPKLLRWSIYFLSIFIIYLFGNYSSSYEFIYFQF